MAAGPKVRTIMRLAGLFPQQLFGVEDAFEDNENNVQETLIRQLDETGAGGEFRYGFHGEEELVKVLVEGFSIKQVLFTLSRLYDGAHMALVAAKRADKSTITPTEAQLIDVRPLVKEAKTDLAVVFHSHIILQPCDDRQYPLEAVWKPVDMFDDSPIDPLTGPLKFGDRTCYIAGGGGSDIITAAAIKSVFGSQEAHGGKLVSVRTWATGSQGADGCPLGSQRIVTESGGTIDRNGKIMAYKVVKGTTVSGRDLEAVVAEPGCEVLLVLDQSESRDQVPPDEQVCLEDQLEAVLSSDIDTICIIDTGGDVLEKQHPGSAVRHQDFRVQEAALCAAKRRKIKNVVTVVCAPGVDAPDDAVETVCKAQGMVYSPSDEENAQLYDLFVKKWAMDGSHPGRYGGTNMVWQAALQGRMGWIVINIPQVNIHTCINPWRVFKFVQDWMRTIIIMPTVSLLHALQDEGGKISEDNR